MLPLKMGLGAPAGALLLFMALAQGCVAQGALARDELQPSHSGPGQVWLARRGWHIDLGLTVSDLEEPLRSVAAQWPHARFVFFGFGDRRYLTAKRRSASTLAAALWPGAGLMLLTAIPGDARQTFGPAQVLSLPLDAGQMRALQGFIRASFSSADPTPVSLGPGPYEGSEYFSAYPRYSGWHTCNTWAAEGLAAAHLPIRARFTLVSGQLWSQASRLRRKLDDAKPSLAGGAG